jgi:hypothetical protein
MLKTQWRQWLNCIPMNHATSARRRTSHRRRRMNEPAADVLEVLESRLLLTPTLAFAVQPSNGIAGHEFKSFTVDVINSGLHRRGTSNLDTSYTGTYLVAVNGPGALVSSTVPVNPGIPPGAPLNVFFVSINHGVGICPSGNFVALDVAGTYTLTVTSPAGSSDGGVTNPGVPGNAVSNSFTISPDRASDHLVFLPGPYQMRPGGPYQVMAGVPFNVSVAVEDQFGNIDTSISQATASLDVLSNSGLGATYMAEFSAGQATFTDVTLPAAPPSSNPYSQDTLLGIAFAGPSGFLAGTTTAIVVSPTTGN